MISLHFPVTSTFGYCTDVVRYVACFGVSFVPLRFLCVQMIFVLDLAE